jgi:para-nitrobenzyl esterase
VVWISGGGYLNCDSANPHLTGAAVAAAGAVLVSAHDRSGFEGFAHQRSTGQPGSPRSARRAILQSIPETYLTIDLAAEISAEICGELGRISSVADLADVAPDDMVAASRTVTGTLLQHFDRWARWPTPPHRSLLWSTVTFFPRRRGLRSPMARPETSSC